jgi:hypothetical protein
MSFKSGFIVGAAVGYVLGTRAGRERYEQIAEMWSSFSGSERFQSLTDKGKDAFDQASAKVRDSMSDAMHAASDKVKDAVEDLGDDEE